jgi:hypothetical protein
MHDGRFSTLDAVLNYYSGVGEQAQSRRDAGPEVGAAIAARAVRYDPRLPRAGFSAQQRADLNAFLTSLTDEAFVHRFAAVDR